MAGPKSDFAYILEVIIQSYTMYRIRQNPWKIISFIFVSGGVVIIAGPFIIFVIEVLLSTQSVEFDLQSEENYIGGFFIAVGIIILAILTYLDINSDADLEIDPLESFFSPEAFTAKNEDPMHIEGQGFYLSTTVRARAKTRTLEIHSITMSAYHRGMALAGASMEFRVDGQSVISVGAEGRPELRRIDGNYNFQPSIKISHDRSATIWIKRKFFPTIDGIGSPYDHLSPEVLLVAKYGRKGDSEIEQRFSFVTEYESNGLASVVKISDVPYLSSRALSYASKVGIISNNELNEIIGIPGPKRLKIAEMFDEFNDDITLKYGISRIQFDLIKKVYSHRHGRGRFDPEKVWHSRVGKIAAAFLKFVDKKNRSN